MLLLYLRDAERLRRAERRHLVAGQPAERRGVTARLDGRTDVAAAAEAERLRAAGVTAAPPTTLCRRWRIGPQVPRHAAQSRRLVQLETAHLTTAFVGDGQHELFRVGQRLLHAVSEDGAVRRV